MTSRKNHARPHTPREESGDACGDADPIEDYCKSLLRFALEASEPARKPRESKRPLCESTSEENALLERTADLYFRQVGREVIPGHLLHAIKRAIDEAVDEIALGFVRYGWRPQRHDDLDSDEDALWATVAKGICASAKKILEADEDPAR